MILYRYFSSHTFETLKAAKLKTSRISTFNDSFEYLYVTIGKKMTPEEAQQSLPALLSNPTFRRGLEESIKRHSYPISIEEVETLLKKNPKTVAELAANIWPDIVANLELPIPRRREIIDRDLRAICFSDASGMTRSEEILLWSHYGKRHEGIRIGMEFPTGGTVPFQLKKIRYEEKRVEVVFSFADESDTLKALEDSAIVKCKVWEYEKEYRLFTMINLCVPEEIKTCSSIAVVEYFLEVNREWVKFVDFGVFCPASDIQPIVNLLKTDYPNTVARQAEFHKTEYALEYRPIY